MEELNVSVKLMANDSRSFTECFTREDCRGTQSAAAAQSGNLGSILTLAAVCVKYVHSACDHIQCPP